MDKRARFYYIMDGTLFRKTFLPGDAKCLSRTEGLLVLRQAHEGGCAEHLGARSMTRKIVRAGFYWPTMKKDAEEIIRKYDSCQKN